jgi:E3 SUMO-protein ligase RanBP2
MSTSTTAWTWFAMDFSQGELISESFAVRFKTEDQATLFKTKFEECQAALKKNTTAVKPTLAESNIVSTLAVTHKEGSWECQGCLARNDATVLKCPCCEAMKPGETLPTVTPQPEVTGATNDAEEEEEEEGEDEETVEEDQDEEEYEDVEESIMFEKRCTLSSLEGGQTDKKWVLLGTGNLKIVYDDEMLCARIVVEDGNEQLLCDNVIAIETELKVFYYFFHPFV